MFIIVLRSNITVAKAHRIIFSGVVHGRCIRSAEAERKVRTPQGRIPRASEGRAQKLGRQVSQKTNRPRKRVRVKRRGKSSPHEQRCSRQDKPNPVQDEIGSRVARPKTSGSSHPQGHGVGHVYMRCEINECSLLQRYRIRLTDREHFSFKHRKICNYLTEILFNR